MIAAWMLYATVVAALAAAAAHAAERGLRIAGRPGRWAWVVAMLLAGVVPLAAPLQDLDPAWPAGARNALGPRPAPADAPPAEPQTTVGAAEAGVALRPTVDVAADSPLSALDRPLRVLWGVGSLAWSGLLVASAVGVARRAARWRPAVVDGVPVLVSHAVGPALVGVLAPEIVLPAWMLDLAPAARSLALAHERAHARARDPLLVAAGAALLVAVPWNPALWYAFSRLRLAVEADCDARVLRAHPDVRAYGALLVDVGERTLVSAAPVAALTGSPTQLARRLDLMVARPPRHAALRVAGAALTSLACVAAACRTPRPAAAPVPEVGGVFLTDSARFAAAGRDILSPSDTLVVRDSTLRGVRLVRTAELPGGGAGPGFDGACAMRLRHPRSGREYLLRRSFTVAPTTREGDTLVTRLERAVGEYEPLDVPSAGRADLTGPRLRVDCVTGEAVGWIAGRAPTEAPPDGAAAGGRAVVRLTSVGLAGVPRTGDGAPVRVLVYASGRARVGVGTAAPEPLTDTLRLDRLPAITADVTDGDVHLVLATPGRMSVGGDVTGGAATHVTATGRHLVLRRGGVGITGEEPMADRDPAGAAAGALPLTDDAKRLLVEARDESDRLRHEYIGTEHLVLALTRRTGSAATAPLAHLGVDGEQVRQTLATMVGPGDSTRASAPGADRPLTTRTHAVLTLAAESARALGQSRVGTGHVLVGILREGWGVGAQVLGHHGLTLEAADAYVRRLRPSDGPR